MVTLLHCHGFLWRSALKAKHSVDTTLDSQAISTLILVGADLLKRIQSDSIFVWCSKTNRTALVNLNMCLKTSKCWTPLGWLALGIPPAHRKSRCSSRTSYHRDCCTLCSSHTKDDAEMQRWVPCTKQISAAHQTKPKLFSTICVSSEFE